MFRLPCLLDPPVAPTAVGFAHRAAGPFTPRNERAVTRHEPWHRYIPEPGNWYGRTFIHWNVALSAATESLRYNYPIFNITSIQHPASSLSLFRSHLFLKIFAHIFAPQLIFRADGLMERSPFGIGAFTGHHDGETRVQISGMMFFEGS